ncbi:hypothetical protein MUP46_03830 [Patescibacteria group bacterium]|nr:hypothetical protein [Patescibacteria group bacterium]
MRNLIIAVIVIVLIAGGYYYWMRVKSGTGSPTPTPANNQITLDVTSPIDGATVSSPSITVSGKTLPGADVFVNDTELTADANGNFSTQLTLDEGDNQITVSANDNNGFSSEQDLTVTYEVPNQ